MSKSSARLNNSLLRFVSLFYCYSKVRSFRGFRSNVLQNSKSTRENMSFIFLINSQGIRNLSTYS